MSTRDFWGIVSRAVGVDIWFTGVAYYACGLDQQPLGKYVVNGDKRQVCKRSEAIWAVR